MNRSLKDSTKMSTKYWHIAAHTAAAASDRDKGKGKGDGDSKGGRGGGEWKRRKTRQHKKANNIFKKWRHIPVAAIATVANFVFALTAPIPPNETNPFINYAEFYFL